MSQAVHLRKYGVQAVINFELYEVDGVDLRVDAADAGSDCTVMKDQGAEATCTNDFVDEGMGYSITLTATEMQAAQITVYIVDSATKVWLDKVLHIETYGNAAAMHAMDFDDAVRGGMTALPNAAADAAGGLPISDAGGLALDTQLANTHEITAVRLATLTDWINGGRLDLLLDAIPTTAMRGTDGANTVVPDAAGVAPTAIEVRAEVDSNSTQLAAILLDTGTSLPALLATIDGIVDAILVDTGTTIPGLIAALNDFNAAVDKVTVDSIDADVVDAVALNADAATEIVDALLDKAAAIEGYTPRQLGRLIAAVLIGKANGLETTTANFRNVADTKNRIVATVDADGNRSAVTLDAT